MSGTPLIAWPANQFRIEAVTITTLAFLPETPDFLSFRCLEEKW